MRDPNLEAASESASARGRETDACEFPWATNQSMREVLPAQWLAEFNGDRQGFEQSLGRSECDKHRDLHNCDTSLPWAWAEELAANDGQLTSSMSASDTNWRDHPDQERFRFGAKILIWSSITKTGIAPSARSWHSKTMNDKMKAVTCHLSNLCVVACSLETHSSQVLSLCARNHAISFTSTVLFRCQYW